MVNWNGKFLCQPFRSCFGHNFVWSGVQVFVLVTHLPFSFCSGHYYAQKLPVFAGYHSNFRFVSDPCITLKFGICEYWKLKFSSQILPLAQPCVRASFDQRWRDSNRREESHSESRNRIWIRFPLYLESHFKESDSWFPHFDESKICKNLRFFIVCMFFWIVMW